MNIFPGLGLNAKFMLAMIVSVWNFSHEDCMPENKYILYQEYIQQTWGKQGAALQTPY